ncbi:MAG: hypothetical protein ACRERR_06370 [Moraxellaceae bacterium]
MCVKFESKRGSTSLFMVPLALAAAVSSVAQAAEVKIPDTTLTASLRTSFTNLSTDGVDTDVNDFALNSLSLYINSKITENIKFSFSSEITSAVTGADFTAAETNSSGGYVAVQDAIAQFEYGPTMNIWAGRFLPPTDRANSYGAYFSNNWNFAVDGTQDGYPFTAFGRADGVAYWGDFADTKLKISAGLFDLPTTLNDNSTMAAARVQYDFWDAEPGYYINGTYLGDKDILAIAVATNMVGSDSTSNVDFLMEKKVGDGGAFTVEGEYIKYADLGGYPAPAATVSSNGDSYYLLTSYLFPTKIGIGKPQLLAKFGTTTYEGVAGADDIDQDTLEVNLNYIIKSFNAKASLFYLDKSYSDSSVADTTAIGLGLQLMTL